MSGAMGAGPLTHGEIDAYQRNNGIVLTPGEIKTLRRLSIEYLNEQSKATDRFCPAPWLPDDEVAKPRATALQESMRALAADV
jgi:hypothetical protein